MTKVNLFKFRKILSLILVAVILCSVGISASAEKLIDRYDSFYNVSYEDKEELLSNSNVIKMYEKSGYTVADATVSVSFDDFTTDGKNFSLNKQDDITSIILEDKTTVNFSFVIEKEGFYELEITYKLKENSINFAKRNILIDGIVPFSEAQNVKFDNKFILSEEKEFDKYGDQLTSAIVSSNEWQTVRLRDSQEQITHPLRFPLSSGKHIVSLEFVENYLEIADIKFVAPEKIADYDSVISKYDSSNVSNKKIVIEAEESRNIEYINVSTILPYSDKDPKMTPVSDENTIFNAIGGDSWGSKGQKIVYKFDVAETGLYKIALRLLQNFSGGATSYRRIEIDGKVPFQEFLSYPFEDDSNWHCEEIEDNDNNPYLIYLEKGKHTIGFTAVTSAEITEASNRCSDIQDDLYAIYRRIILITGTSPDPNYLYELDKTVPELLPELKRIIKSLEEIRELISKAQTNTSNDNEIKKIISQLNDMCEDTDVIPLKLSDFTDATNTLGKLYSSLIQTPLALDTIYILSEDVETDSMKSSLWSRIWTMLKDFVRSFSNDYNLDDVVNKENELNIWISRGTAYVEAMKSLIYKDFEAKYNCSVSMNVMPSGTLNGGSQNPLMLAVASGNAPDLVMNVNCTTPVEYGIRGIAEDVSKFETYQDVISRYVPNIMNAFKFQGKIFALPESLTFNVMAYRTDIFEELGLSVPQTWDEVYYQLLPVLYQNNMQMGAVGFATLLYQQGGRYYAEDGLSVKLDTLAAHEAFETYTNQFLDLGFPISANFFNRFKSGEMPIGFLDFGSYLQILVAAPELANKWTITNIPGTKNSDGSIDRTNTSLVSSCNMILKPGNNVEIAWHFLDWWSTVEVQTQYGLRVESSLGIGARANPATIEAYHNLPWNSNDLKVIFDAWNNAVEEPYVLGGVITGREVSNATNNVLYNNYTSRLALEDAVKNINNELLRKQEMYNIRKEK